MGCAMVLIGSVTAATPADTAERDEAVALHATPWASAAAEARTMDPFAMLLANRGWR
ncbi:MAG: hypothetical protein OXB97_11355 [Rhodospirillales bacterium]|nr:hypothetical protein [Rhodospirillales bacterium]